jgi:hypothetical protein
MKNIKLENHLRDNLSLSDYQLLITGEEFCHEEAKLIFDATKFKKELIKKIKENSKLAQQRIDVKLNLSVPTTGDFLKIGKEYYRLVSVSHSQGIFQYCHDGSFYLNDNGNCSYSGGFCFDHGSNFKAEELKVTNKFEIGRFWFFSQDKAKAHNGVYFNDKFKVWKLK